MVRSHSSGIGTSLQLDSSTPLVASVLLVTSNALMALFFLGFVVLRKTPVPSKSEEPHLHWDPEIQRRGMGDLIRSVNHIAIIVADVGRSLAFYTEIIGFQQIQRPNFDRHGAWLTMGNLELHLIKGCPMHPLVVTSLCPHCLGDRTTTQSLGEAAGV